MTEDDDRKAWAAFGNLAIHTVRIFDDSIPTVGVGHVTRLTSLRDALAVASVVMGVCAVPGGRERLRKRCVPRSVLRHPVQHLYDRLGLLDYPPADMQVGAVDGLK